MYCDYHEEHVGESDCFGCTHECKKNMKAEEKAAEREKEVERLRGSALAMEIRATLSTSLNLSEERIDTLILDLFDGAFATAESQLKCCLRDLANKMAVEYIEVKAKKVMDAAFQEALDGHIVELTKSGKEGSNITKIRKIITNRMLNFFAEKDDYNSRNSTEKTIESAIGRVVDAQVKDALKEITEEAIEKFNKEAMKKMMNGMVGAIQNDKRLLAVLAPD